MTKTNTLKNKSQLALEKSLAIISEKEAKLLEILKVKHGTKFKIICKNNHIWNVQQYRLNSGRSCKQCYIKDVTSKRNDRLLKLISDKLGSLIYEIGENITIQCSESHIWSTKKGKILAGHWCKICSKSKSEELCRAYLEELFEEKFPSKKVFKSPETGYWMELDGYCEKLGLAFEYNGAQHYGDTFPKQDFEKTKRYDVYKQNLCEQYGIKLLIIPTFFKMLDLKDFNNFILNECEKLNVKMSHKDIDIDSLIITNKNKQLFDTIKYNIEKSNAICHTNTFVNIAQKIKIECKQKHIFYKKAAKIVRSIPNCPMCNIIISIHLKIIEKFCNLYA